MEIRKVGVVGAGTMGNGIAQAFATSGYDVVMRDIKQEFVDRGMSTIKKSLERLASRNKITSEAKDAALARVKGPSISIRWPTATSSSRRRSSRWT